MARKLPPFLKRTAARLPEMLLAAACLGTVGAPLGIWSSQVERMSHFRLWWLGLLVCLVLWFLWRKRWILGVVGLAAAVWAFVPLLPYWREAPRPALSADAPRLKVIAWNLLWENSRHAEALAWLKAQDADIVVLTECTFAWHKALSPLTEIYPHHLSSNRDGAEGMWVLSRYPLDAPDSAGLAQKKPWISTVAHTPAGPLRVLGMHPRTPRSGTRFDERNVQYDQAARIASSSAIPVVLMGDLNCTPFSPWFSRLLGRGKLRDSALGHGLRGTWSGQGISLPIDHILVSREVAVFERNVHADSLGSDHHPVISVLCMQSAK